MNIDIISVLLLAGWRLRVMEQGGRGAVHSVLVRVMFVIPFRPYRKWKILRKVPELKKWNIVILNIDFHSVKMQWPG